PIGSVGEIFIGGPGLARGYLNQPALTAERFVPHPCGECPGERLYRSGDLARYRNDGALEYLGRQDQQMKWRGYRIEPGEIEARLRAYPQVRECAVLPYEAQPPDLHLAAYIVATPADGTITQDRLR